MEQTNYFKTIVAGLISAVAVAAIWTGLGIWLESEYKMVILIGMCIIAGAVSVTVPHSSLLGAAFAAVLCPAAFLLYNEGLKAFGYAMTDENVTRMPMALIGGIIIGAWIGFNNEKKKKVDE